MKIGDILYFSPKYRFDKLDFENKEIMISAFQDRVEGYYLIPAEELVSKHAFGSGVLCVSTIDFLARFETGLERVGIRFENWTKNNIEEFNRTDPDNSSKTLAYRFYEEFRNGLVHEGRIKNAGQFSDDLSQLVEVMEGVMIISPKYLLDKIKESFKRYIEKINKNEDTFQALKCALIDDFRSDFKVVNK